MSTIVHSMGVGGQNWVKFGPRSCRMPPQQKKMKLQGHSVLTVRVR